MRRLPPGHRADPLYQPGVWASLLPGRLFARASTCVSPAVEDRSIPHRASIPIGSIGSSSVTLRGGRMSVPRHKRFRNNFAVAPQSHFVYSLEYQTYHFERYTAAFAADRVAVDRLKEAQFRRGHGSAPATSLVRVIVMPYQAHRRPHDEKHKPHLNSGSSGKDGDRRPRRDRRNLRRSLDGDLPSTSTRNDRGASAVGNRADRAGDGDL